jgi:hypothetical protein
MRILLTLLDLVRYQYTTSGVIVDDRDFPSLLPV